MHSLGFDVERIANRSFTISWHQRTKYGIPVISTRLNNLNIQFACESPREQSRIEQYTRITKEPETYEWIDRFIKNGEILYDIGSNTGGYSLYSVKKHPDLKVYCFDPDVQNISQLNKNILINQMTNNIMGFCACISECDYIAEFNITSEEAIFSAGHSGNMINTNINRSGEQEIVTRTGSIQLSIDSLVNRFGFPCPNHIKIDVDGGEDKVIDGAKQTLEQDNVKSILIELDYNNSELINLVISKGFVEFTTYVNEIYHEMERKEHIPAGMGNKVFIRKHLI